MVRQKMKQNLPVRYSCGKSQNLIEGCKLVADFIEDGSDEGAIKRHLADGYLKAQDANDKVHVACSKILEQYGTNPVAHWNACTR